MGGDGISGSVRRCKTGQRALYLRGREDELVLVSFLSFVHCYHR